MSEVMQEAIDIVIDYYCEKYNITYKLEPTKEMIKRIKKWYAETGLEEPYIIAAAAMNSPYNDEWTVKKLKLITMDYFPQYKRKGD